MRMAINIRERKKRPKLKDFLKLFREKKKEVVAIEEKRLEEALDVELNVMAKTSNLTREIEELKTEKKNFRRATS